MRKKILFALKAIAVIIMLQTFFFKFYAANQSVELFTKIAGEHEAYLRIGTGIIELISSILLFTSNRSWLGALMTLGVMSGAILGHITILGISHNNDGGLLFGAAVYIFIVALVVLINQRKKIFILGKHF